MLDLSLKAFWILCLMSCEWWSCSVLLERTWSLSGPVWAAGPSAPLVWNSISSLRHFPPTHEIISIQLRKDKTGHSANPCISFVSSLLFWIFPRNPSCWSSQNSQLFLLTQEDWQALLGSPPPSAVACKHSPGCKIGSHRTRLICFSSQQSVSCIAWCPISEKCCFIYFI